MTANPAAAIERLRDRLDDSDEISDADATALQRVSDRIRILGPAKYSDHRHEFILRRCVIMAERVGGLADALEDRTAAERLVAWINTEQTNSAETNRDYRVVLRMFGELATDDEGKPDSIEWIPSTYPKNYDPAPDPSNMLRWEDDILPMVDACHNLRDKALITLAWDAGPRSGELHSLTVGDVSDHEYGLQITVNGKQGRRSPLLIPSVPHVQRWMSIHPGRDDHDAPMWSKLSTASSITPNRMRAILTDAADRADVSRPVTPTNFRKSSASYLASEGVPQPHLEDHHGWQRGSSTAARYISVFGDATDRALAEVHGLDIEDDEPDRIAPQTCPRCNRETPRDEPLCVFCGQALTPTAVDKATDQDSRFFQSAGQADGGLFEDLSEVKALVDENPALRRFLMTDS